jgi:D-aminopeptidase
MGQSEKNFIIKITIAACPIGFPINLSRRKTLYTKQCKSLNLILTTLFMLCTINLSHAQLKIRARDLGIPFNGTPGAYNAITDVPYLEVGHVTIIEGEGDLVVGQGPIRTGVTAILPRGKTYDPVFAAWNSLNACGEMTGTQIMEERGAIDAPILITNSSSVGLVRDSLIKWQIQNNLIYNFYADYSASLPVVAETYDGLLNDIHGFHVKEEHVFAALDQAASGPVEEGNVGGGTGMVCHQFKGGIGTASRIVSFGDSSYTVGVLVQANHGTRPGLTIAGVPVGQEIPDLMPEIHASYQPGSGSIIVVVATDAPLLPYQLKRLALRPALGIAKVGGVGSDTSGDIFLAFSTGNSKKLKPYEMSSLTALSNEQMTRLFQATVEATEESIINAMVAAETMTGIRGNTVYALPQDRLIEALKKYNRYAPSLSSVNINQE